MPALTLRGAKKQPLTNDELDGNFAALNAAADAATTALAGKADANHTQGIATVTGLQAALDGKAPADHTQAIGTVTGLQAALDAASGFSPAGTGAVARPVGAKLRDLPAAPGDYADADALLASPPAKEFHSGTLVHKGLDGSEQFRIGWTPLAVENWRAYGGGLRGGATFVAWSETSTNVDGNFTAKGQGGFYWANGAGVLAAVEGNGSGVRVANHLAMRPGDPGKPGVLAAASWGGEANVGVALLPLGTGALTASVPDNAAAGGNARGTYAVDWQRTRAAGQQVAAGGYSVICGGDGNEAPSSFSGVPWGQFNVSRGQFAGAFGLRADTGGAYGKVAHASGRFAASGDAQQGWAVLRAQSTSATPVRLTADAAAPGAANTANMPNNSAMRIRGTWIASQVSGTAGTAGDTAGGDWAITVKRYGNAANTFKVVNATVSKDADPGAAAWVLAVDVDTTNGGLAVSFTGEANKTVKAVAAAHSVEVIR